MDQNRLYWIAAAVYDGGWRAEDKVLMMEEFGYTEEEITLICKRLQEIAELDKEEEDI